MNYQKYIGEKVLVTCDGIYFGRIGTLTNVVDTEWLNQTKIAHVTLDGSVPITLPITQIVVYKKED